MRNQNENGYRAKNTLPKMNTNRNKNIPRELRDQVMKRDNHTCRYCGRRSVYLDCDHVYPVSRGGETTLDNLVAACHTCNTRKNANIGVWPLPLDWLQREADLMARIAKLEISQAVTPFVQPDLAIDLAYLKLPVNRGLYIFICASEQRPAHHLRWSSIPGAQIITLGDVDEAMRQLFEHYSNDSLAALLDGIHSEIVSAVRRHYGIYVSRRRRTMNGQS